MGENYHRLAKSFHDNMYIPQNTMTFRLLVTLLLFTPSLSLSTENHDSLFCESWHFSVETNNAGNWSTIPGQCYEYVKDYMTGDRYVLDTKLVARNALDFAKTVNIMGDGKDAWIFDVDDTLLSFLPYDRIHGFGIQVRQSKEFRHWGMRHKVPAIEASLSLYKELRQLGFTIFLLTGRPEYLRNFTVANLLYVGYTNWERLILRESFDEGKSALEYKSGRRKQLEHEGYRIHGSSGDQWSDLLGYPVAQRSFKLPNPMYYAG